MAKTQDSNQEYTAFKKAVAEGCLKNAYVLYGEERYLLEYYLGELRKLLLPAGLEEFNHRRFSAKEFSVPAFAEAVDSLPVFTQRTLIEVHDYDIYKCGDEVKKELIAILSDAPEYVCAVFVYDTIEYKPDGRLKTDAAMKKLVTAVEFRVQDQSSLVTWIRRRFHALDKDIDKTNAEYLAFITGGLMTGLVNEIGKVAAYSTAGSITKKDIDAVVTPVLDAVSYKLTDALVSRDYDTAARLMGDLLRMQEPPHKIMYSISLKMRQLLAARICVEYGKGVDALMDLCGIRMEFQARNLMAAARRCDSHWCKAALNACSETAFELNSSGSSDYSGVMSRFLVKSALLGSRMVGR